jgi:thioredoxin 1
MRTYLGFAFALVIALGSAACGSTEGPSTTDGVTNGGDKDDKSGNGNGNTNGDNGTVASDPGPKIQVINEPGQLIDIAEFMPAGHVTVVDFYADWCGACKIAEEKLVTGIEAQERIVVRKVNIDDDTSAVAKHYDVGALPHLRVYDGNGELAYVLVGNDAMTAAEKAVEVLNR